MFTLRMRQVGEGCGGRDRDVVEGGLRHGGLRAARGALRSHQHHRRVGGWRVVRCHHARLHVRLRQRYFGQLWPLWPRDGVGELDNILPSFGHVVGPIEH